MFKNTEFLDFYFWKVTGRAPEKMLNIFSVTETILEHFFNGPDIFSVAQTFFQWPRHFFSSPGIFSVAQTFFQWRSVGIWSVPVHAAAHSCAAAATQLRPSCGPSEPSWAAAAAHLDPSCAPNRAPISGAAAVTTSNSLGFPWICKGIHGIHRVDNGQ